MKTMAMLKQISLLAEEYIHETKQGDFIRDVIDIFIASENLKNTERENTKSFEPPNDSYQNSNHDYDDDIPF